MYNDIETDTVAVSLRDVRQNYSNFLTASRKACQRKHGSLSLNIPSRPELQTCWRGRCTGQRWSPPSARSACTAAEAPMSPSAYTFQTWRRRCLSVVFNVFFYLCGFGKRVQPDQVDLQRALLLHGQGEGQVAEGVEGHRDFGADGADQRGLEEAMEDVHDDGVVPLDVALPRLLRHHLAARGRWRKTSCIKLRLHANFTQKKICHNCKQISQQKKIRSPASLCLACRWRPSAGCKASS